MIFDYLYTFLSLNSEKFSPDNLRNVKLSIKLD